MKQALSRRSSSDIAALGATYSALIKAAIGPEERRRILVRRYVEGDITLEQFESELIEILRDEQR
jgi:hypothetical protein